MTGDWASPPEPGLIRNRHDGTWFREIVHGGWAVKALYGPPFTLGVRWLLAHVPAISRAYGRLQERPASRRAIAPFIRRFGMDTTEFLEPPESFPHFNAFFARRLKAEARPLDPDPDRLLSPGDGKILVFPSIGTHLEMPVKGASARLETLLGSAELAAAYRGGSGLVLRLAPYDYHRFHFPASGQAGTTSTLAGPLHSVHPLALARVPGVLEANLRTLTFLDTQAFGRLALIEVGALCVGSIVQTHEPGPVTRGQEKGHFAFGGSTTLLLAEPGRVRFDEDLVAASLRGVEVQVRMGSAIATRG
ncbi:MAG: phosphatidylserine decarboxylase [Candidatus Sericytochromatia bacterium]|nr:phosphatidylserine decarboxylase [Candidatus Sericytochromatia bacterium]